MVPSILWKWGVPITEISRNQQFLDRILGLGSSDNYLHECPSVLRVTHTASLMQPPAPGLTPQWSSIHIFFSNLSFLTKKHGNHLYVFILTFLHNLLGQYILYTQAFKLLDTSSCPFQVNLSQSVKKYVSPIYFHKMRRNYPENIFLLIVGKSTMGQVPLDSFTTLHKQENFYPEESSGIDFRLLRVHQFF